MGAWVDAGGVLFLGVAVVLLASCESSSMGAGGPRRGSAAKPEVSLDFEYFPRGEERALRLLVSRPEIGLAFKLHCFESAPFRNGTAEKRPDGSVVFSYTAGEMKCVTTFAPKVGGRVEMNVVASGPLEELKKIKFIDGCMQHWESPAFRRRGALTEFAERAFIYTMRGPASLLDTPRGNQKAFAADSPWNNPPGTQWYVHPSAQHPGDVWGFGTCGDRPVIGLIGAVSRDGKWLTAIGRPYNLSIGQGWHDCLHCGGHTRWYLNEKESIIRQRTMLYVMPNDKEALAAARLADFPGDEGVTAEPSDNQGLADPRPGSRLGKPLAVEGSGEVLRVRPPVANAPGLDLALDVAGRAGDRSRWQRAYWGTSFKEGRDWKMWAHPVGNAVELCVSVSAAAARSGEPIVQASLTGKGWSEGAAAEGTPSPSGLLAPAAEAKPQAKPEPANAAHVTRGVPAKLLRSKDGAWTAGLFWERSAPEDPAKGVGDLQEPGARTVSVRGRLVVAQGGPAEFVRQWAWAEQDWCNARPYRMPAPGAEGTPSPSGLLAPAAEAQPQARPEPGDAAQVTRRVPTGDWVTFAPGRQPGRERLTYGLTVVPPWKASGSLHVNFPEHLEYDDEDPTNDYVGYSLLRHSDASDSPWRISADGRTASFQVESPHEPGVVVEARFTAQASQAVMWMKITNGSGKKLPRVKPLLCFQYKGLTGFPQGLDGNFAYTYVVIDGKTVRLADLATARPDPQAMVAYVKGCGQHDCDKFANSRGGLIGEELDAAVAAVTAKDGRRKVVLGFAPPKSMLSNSFIPCLHADPYFGDLEPGQSAEASGVIMFTEGDLEPAVKEAVGLEWTRGAGR